MDLATLRLLALALDGVDPDFFPGCHPGVKTGLLEEKAATLAESDCRYTLALPMGLKPVKFNPQVSSSFFGVHEV